MSPVRAGLVYGAVAVVVALVADLRFLFIDPEGIPDWILTAIEEFRTQLALATFLFLAILAALRTRPDRLDPGVPYRSLLLRDCTLAATVVAVMVGITLLLVTALNATLFANTIRDYARDASPSIVAYSEKVAGRLNDPPPTPTVEEVEEDLQPPPSGTWAVPSPTSSSGRSSSAPPAPWSASCAAPPAPTSPGKASPLHRKQTP